MCRAPIMSLLMAAAMRCCSTSKAMVVRKALVAKKVRALWKSPAPST
jgi:hypothetical protein